MTQEQLTIVQEFQDAIEIEYALCVINQRFFYVVKNYSHNWSSIPGLTTA
jgi:hypothetical protein